MNKNYLTDVREQYEHLPYPERNPADEKQRLIQTNLDYLPRINHYCFRGKRDFAKEFNLLVAGGGTGDATIYLAEQLRDTAARISYLDISSASMDIARQRAVVRKLSNIDWIHGSILDLDPDVHGRFDYINCSGVLHHLQDPLAGLKSLKSVLAAEGAMGLMVYAKYGRTAVYQIQELMRLINREQMDGSKKIANTWKALDFLPATNWWKRSEELHTDHKRYGDIGLYDLFLHTQDRAYSIPELHQWLAGAELEFIDFAADKIDYDPRAYIKDKDFLKLIMTKSDKERHAIAELVSGTIIKHTFYCASSADTVARPTDDMVPVFADPTLREDILNEMIPEHYGDNYIFRTQLVKFTIPINEIGREIIQMMDGTRSIQQIVEQIIEKLKLNSQLQGELSQNIYNLCQMFIQFDEIYLSGMKK